jgi:hypothetical protein
LELVMSIFILISSNFANTAAIEFVGGPMFPTLMEPGEMRVRWIQNRLALNTKCNTKRNTRTGSGSHSR